VLLSEISGGEGTEGVDNGVYCPSHVWRDALATIRTRRTPTRRYRDQISGKAEHHHFLLSG